MPATIMLQGAGSNVGKSVLVAGLCRHFSNAGLRVRPFKPQNMSNNAAVTLDGGEIGRAQAMQARGCRAETSVHMNPVLLKPESETGSQVIVQGKRFGSMRAREYGSHKAELLPRVLESFDIVGRDADLVIVEGAGSPAEVNLRAGDIANMGFAVAADVPVVMVGDIDRGGVIASLVGTDAVLDEADRALIKGVPDQQVSRRHHAVRRRHDHYRTGHGLAGRRHSALVPAGTVPACRGYSGYQGQVW